jgi:hypothetical protein
MKNEKTLAEWKEIHIWCITAKAVAPWWSPMRLFFSFGVWYSWRQVERINKLKAGLR